MAGNAKLVALGVSEVCAVVVGVILRPQTRCSLGSATARERHCIRSINDRTILCQEGDHLTVANPMWSFVIGPSDKEERPRLRMGLPTCPRTLGFTEPLFVPEDRHERSVEDQRAIEVCDADKDVRVHARWFVALVFLPPNVRGEARAAAPAARRFPPRG